MSTAPLPNLFTRLAHSDWSGKTDEQWGELVEAVLKAFLLDLVGQLRASGLQIGIDQQALAIEALRAAIEAEVDIADPAAMAEIYRLVFAKSQAEQQIFDRCFIATIEQAKQRAELLPPVITSVQPQEITSTENTTVSQVESGFWQRTWQKLQQWFSTSSKSSEPESVSQSSNIPTVPERSSTTIHLPSEEIDVVTAIATAPSEGDYFPVKQAQMLSAWRSLQVSSVTKRQSEIDIRATVEDTAKRGFFIYPIYQTSQRQPRQLILLVDQSASMMPFNPLCRRLIQSWSGAQVYYFQNTPRKLYTDPSCWQDCSLNSVLTACKPQQTAFVILSDAGAANDEYFPEQVAATERFIRRAHRIAQSIAWLNPMPRQRWSSNSAQDICELELDFPNLKMFALEAQEFIQLGQWLQGSRSVGIAEPTPSNQVEPEIKTLTDLPITAAERVDAFAQQFGEAHLWLAEHAAFPLALTPDLGYRIWQEFFDRSLAERQLQVPWYAVADLLLSSLCRRIEVELYELEPEIRTELLKRCRHDQRFGVTRLAQLSEFLIRHLERQVGHSPATPEFNQAQFWTALAYTQPSAAAHKLAEALQQAYLKGNKANLVKLSSLVETLAEPLGEDYHPLLIIARGYGSYARGDRRGIETSQTALQDRTSLRGEIDIAGIALKLPGTEVGGIILKTIELEVATISFEEDEPTDENELQPFEFETVMVNSEGQITRWWKRLGRQFIEPLPTLTIRKAGDNTGLLFVEAKLKERYPGERKLSKAEKKVFRGIWNQLSYDEIYKLVANDGNFSPSTLREDVFLDLAGTLSEILSATVTEDNLAETVQRAIDQAGGFELKTDLEMVAIRGGEFLMGSADDDPQGYDDERPQHKVTVAPFFMSKYPVTQAQWMAIVSWAGEETDLKVDPARFKGMDRPVEQVSWYDAEKFCQLLSSHTGRTYRLPTEAEWEYACRAETTTVYCFGDTLTTELANYDQNIGETTPVDQFYPNPFGLYDMHGNVYEWCLDHWHDNYKGAPTDGTAWLSSNESARRVRRGGSWNGDPRYCRSAYRDVLNPGSRGDSDGFRVMCEARRT